LIVAGDRSLVDLPALFDALARLGVQSVLVEGGARVFTEVLRHRLADRCVAFVAAKILGKGIETIGDLSIDSIDASILLEDIALEAAGSDIVLRGRLKYR
jgi:diaminohydroxyphosphoribosylaminopyrimidine deaminase/5-amino-6-(5-phosphoribosylamino)uracil reductase